MATRIGFGCYKGKRSNAYGVMGNSQNIGWSNVKITRGDMTIIVPHWCLKKADGSYKKIVAEKLKNLTDENKAWLEARGVDFIPAVAETALIA